MSQSNAISIKLEISIPTGVAAHAVAAAPTFAVATTQPKQKYGVTEWCPADGDRHPVRPTGTGSGGAVGSICAMARLADPPPDSRKVRAQVTQSDPAGLGDTPDLGATIEGDCDSTGKVWTWKGGKELPGVVHSPSGVVNYFVVWEPTNTSPGWFQQPKQFYGVTGTTDPCGSSSDPCAPGSNPMRAFRQAAAPSTYPAVWLVVVAGLDGPFAPFNACWGLREVRSAGAPTWDNAGDGTAAPGVRLVLCPKNGWELVLRLGGSERTWSVPFAGNAFGPVVFLGGAGGPPSIVASAV